jgi:hypothetical protein
MRKLLKLLVALAAVTSGMPALAETINNVKALAVGNQATQLYTVLSAVPQGCRNATLYHSSETQAGQYVMSILLTARLADRPLGRIDYTIRTDGSCWITLAEI